MQKNRFATWALDPKDNNILTTLELNTDNFNIDINTYSKDKVSVEYESNILNKWVKGEEIELIEPTNSYKKNFTDESILPDEVKVDGKSGAIRQLQNEWSYLLLNTKLLHQFSVELEELKNKANILQEFSHDVFKDTKEFWEKIMEYGKEREISRDAISDFKIQVDEIFDKLKDLKDSMIKEKEEVSVKVKEEFLDKIEKVKSESEQPNAHFKTLIDTLISYQRELKSHNLIRDIKNMLFDELQIAFELVKNKREEVLGKPSSKIDSRIEDLTKILTKIEKSLEYDKKDLDYNNNKINDNKVNKLELQLREAKIKVIEDKIKSKVEKIEGIKATLEKLKSKNE